MPAKNIQDWKKEKDEELARMKGQNDAYWGSYETIMKLYEREIELTEKIMERLTRPWWRLW